MFETPEPSDQDCDDVLTEMTNIMGGMVKGLLPAPTSLKLPILQDVSDLPEGAAPTHVLVMGQDTHDMSVLLMSESERAAA